MDESGTDEELMCRYRDGDPKAFEWLYTRHKAPVYRYVRRQCGQGALADEIFQDVWLNLVRTRERYTVEAKFTTYLYRIAHNRLVDHYRAQTRRDAHFEATVEDVEDLAVNRIEPSRQVEAERAGQRLKSLITGLPAEQREAFLLHEEGGFSIKDIAELTDVGKETTKSRLRYAFKKLRDALAEPS